MIKMLYASLIYCFALYYRDIICIDKTGTLTMNTAIMVNYFDSWGSSKEKVLSYAFLNAYFKTQQKYPLDNAIMAYVYTNGFRFQPSRWSKIDEIPFDFTRRRVSVILETRLNEKNNYFHDRVVVTKGALEDVIKVCSFIEHVDDGDIMAFSEEDCQRILNMAEELSADGLRILGVGVKSLGTVCSDLFLLLLHLSFVSFLSFHLMHSS